MRRSNFFFPGNYNEKSIRIRVAQYTRRLKNFPRLALALPAIFQSGKVDGSPLAEEWNQVRVKPAAKVRINTYKFASDSIFFRRPFGNSCGFNWSEVSQEIKLKEEPDGASGLIYPKKNKTNPFKSFENCPMFFPLFVLFLFLFGFAICMRRANEWHK